MEAPADLISDTGLDITEIPVGGLIQALIQPEEQRAAMHAARQFDLLTLGLRRVARAEAIALHLASLISEVWTEAEAGGDNPAIVIYNLMIALGTRSSTLAVDVHARQGKASDEGAPWLA
jgi:hypothetical protein